MKILWITNDPIEKHCELTKTSQVSGGWITAALEMLKGNNSIEICIATTWPVKKKIVIKELNIEYVLLPGGYSIKYNPNKKSNIEEWKLLIAQFKPDVIHIHGTEFSHGLCLMHACPDEKYILSIQGMCSIIERYYFAGMRLSDILKNITLRDILRWDTLIHARRKFRIKGYFENEYIKTTKHVIGRTTWDFVHTMLINEKLQYHFCNEILRPAFYVNQWNIDSIKRHTIFCSQTQYPLKGFHMLLKAVKKLRKDFGDIEVFVAGYDITKATSLIEKVKLSGYGQYLRKLIKKCHLSGIIHFTGNLNEQQMALRYVSSHVFVCPSSIENSSNSIGEAQLVGIPCVASYAGGIPDMIKNGETGLLYQFEEYEMLAYRIRQIFENDSLALGISEAGRAIAFERHDRVKNTKILVGIYNKM